MCKSSWLELESGPFNSIEELALGTEITHVDFSRLPIPYNHHVILHCIETFCISVIVSGESGFVSQEQLRPAASEFQSSWEPIFPNP